ncbi:hypothetical protein GW916_02150 [bacterium]|nr:hypothetical protein [bacterium]
MNTSVVYAAKKKPADQRTVVCESQLLSSFLPSEISATRKEKLEKLVGDLKHWLGDLQFLQSTKIELSEENKAHSGPNKISISQSYLKNWKEGQVVVVHEIGHQYFRDAVIKQSSQFADLAHRHKKYLDSWQRGGELLDEIMEVHAKQSGPNGEAYLDALKRLNEENLANGEFLKSYDQGYEKMTVYNEFFADFFTVLFFDDPLAVSRTMSDEKEKVGRSFAERVDPNTWDSEAALHSYFSETMVIYYHLSPSKYVAWKVAERLKEKGFSPRQILDAVFKAIASDIVAHDFQDPIERSVLEVNQSFILKLMDLL